MKLDKIIHLNRLEVLEGVLMTKEELKGYIETKREIKIIEEKIEYLESKKTSIKSIIIDDMPKPEPEQDRLGELLGEIEE